MTPEQINNFFSFLYEGSLGASLFWVRLVSGVLTSAFFAAIVVIILKLRHLIVSAGTATPAPQPFVPTKEVATVPWGEVQERLASPNPADWNLAVIRADSIFDAVLKDMGLPGETMGDRLKGLDISKLNSLNDVWEAHKIRNRIAHETDRVLTHQEAKHAVHLFAQALRELEYLGE